MSRYYDIDGNPLGLADWAMLFEHRAGESQISTTIGDVQVSTVWLGLDHNVSGEGPPLIFETMVFGGPLDGEMERYSTKEQAAEGHARWAAKVEENAKGPPERRFRGAFRVMRGAPASLG